MKTVVFGGVKFAEKLEAKLKTEVAEWVRGGGRRPKITSIVFGEDRASRVYTQYKLEAAERVGMEFVPVWLSFGCKVEKILESIQNANNDQKITGVMVQKPARRNWLQFRRVTETSVADSEFDRWWQSLVTQIAPNKDVDGLSPVTQKAIVDGSWTDRKVCLPATVSAVLQILAVTGLKSTDKIAVIGRSDIIGRPLFNVLTQRGYDTSLLGIKAFSERCRVAQYLLDFDVIISATGQAKLMTGSMVKSGVIAIDVGEPKSDFEFGSVSAKAKFITPVPGGVGPVTIVSLLENSLWLNNHDARTTAF